MKQNIVLSNHLIKRVRSDKGWGGGGTPRKKLGRGVRPASQNPYPIYDQNLRFSLSSLNIWKFVTFLRFLPHGYLSSLQSFPHGPLWRFESFLLEIDTKKQKQLSRI